MTRDTSTDAITAALIDRYAVILRTLAGWGILADSSTAVYPGLWLPLPQEPFPAAYVYLAGVQHDFTQGRGIRRDICTITVRILGGPITPGYKFNPETKVYEMVTAVVNELGFRPFLQDPTDGNAPFRYLDPNTRQSIGAVGRIAGFSYGEQGNFVGIEIPSTCPLIIPMGRIS